MNDILKPCPFCGGRADSSGHRRYVKPLKDQAWADGSPVAEEFFVNCTECGLSNGSFPRGGFQTTALAIEAWNKRTLACGHREGQGTWEPSFTAKQPEKVCGSGRGEWQWHHLALRCALLHHLATCKGSDISLTSEIEALADWYADAGPEFCTALLDQHERCFEVPF